MSQYLTPPKDFAIEYIMGTARLGFAILIIIGIAIIIASVGYIGIQAIKAVRGSALIPKKAYITFIVALLVGTLLTGSGWIRILQSTSKIMIQPSSKIIQKHETKVNK